MRVIKKKKKRKKILRPKKCKFCVAKVQDIDYKDINRMKKFLTDQGKIIARKITGNCAKHQRQMTGSIKRAREMALLPYCGN
jgi:small subunit ribosomal protein S18